MGSSDDSFDIDKDADPGTFVRLNERTGELETVCMYTGKVVDTNAVVVGASSEVSVFRFSPEIARAVLSLIRDGETLRSICMRPGFPPRSVLANWRRRLPAFDRELRDAEEDRGDYYYDKVVELVDAVGEMDDKNEIAASKVAIDGYKWAAKVGNKEKYGDKVAVDANHSGQIGFYALKTGIDRGDPVVDEDVFVIDNEEDSGDTEDES